MGKLSKIFNNFKNTQGSNLSSLLNNTYFDDFFIERLKKGQEEILKEVTIRDQGQWNERIFKSNYSISPYFHIYSSVYFHSFFVKNPYIITYTDNVIFRIYKNEEIIHLEKMRVRGLFQLDVFVYEILNKNTEKVLTNADEKNNNIRVTMQLESGKESLDILERMIEGINLNDEASNILSSCLFLLDSAKRVVDKEYYILEKDFWDKIVELNSPYRDLIYIHFLKFKKTRNLIHLLNIHKDMNILKKPSWIKRLSFKLRLLIFKLKGLYA